MKSAKKLLLLVLSLVLLIGVFAVAAFAEEEAPAATVVYPDGTTETFDLGETITGKEFENGFYQGAGNTLFKDDATAGWTFTLEGETNALTDLTVTEAMSGKVILAGGADKVYATVEITINEGNYAIWLGGKKYVIAGTTAVSDGTALEAPARKIPVGTHKLYLMNEGDVASFLTTKCSFEIDGVTYTYQDIRNLSRNAVRIKMYADETISNLGWASDNADRPQTTLPASGASAGGGTAAAVYLDMNGHNITSTRTSIIDFRSMTLYIYSSVKGAHFFATETTGAFIYPNNDAALHLGEDASASTTYHDNINFHMKELSSTAFGGGIYIEGGRYYQTEGGTSFVSMNQRVYAFKNAKFFLQDGATLLNFQYTTTVTVTLSNCEVYTSGTADLLYAQTYVNSAGVATVGKPTVTASNCKFFGVTKNYVKPEGDAITPVINVKYVADGGTNTLGDAIVYQSVLWVDGTSDYYFATNEADAKFFVENHPKAKSSKDKPYSIITDGGKTMHRVFDPDISYTYDEKFNAIQTDAGEVFKIYYTVTHSDGTVEYHTENDYAKTLQAFFPTWTPGATVTLYNDVAFTQSTTVKTVGGTAKAYLDLNGHLWTIPSVGTPVIDISYAIWYLYSSTPGGKAYAPNAGFFTRSNTGGVGYFGERDITKTEYGANLTVETTRVNGDLYGSGIGIYGGTYVQCANSSYNHLMIVSRINSTGSQFLAIQNATFVLNKKNSSAIHWINAGFNSIANCTFIGNASGATPICNATTNATATYKTPTFDNCKFINVNPTASLLGDKYPIYRNCVFSLTDAITAPVYLDGTTKTPLYLAKINVTDSITYNGVSYPINYALKEASELLTVEWMDGTHPYWALGTSPISNMPADAVIEKQTDGTYVVTCYRFYYPTDILTVNVEHLGTTVGVSMQDGETFPLAFSYQVAGDYARYAPLLETKEANGQNFASTLNNLSNVSIKMYTDIVLTKGVLFGTLKDYKDAKDKVVSIIDKSGNVDWDLNGYTVTVPNDAKPLRIENWQESEGSKTFSCMHYIANGTFKLYSSAEGGQYINHSSASIFGALKYEGTKASYILGTNDLSQNGGENLTVVSNGMILLGYENNASGPAGVLLGINGGTYIYSGSIAAFNCGGDVRIYNAKVVTTGSAQSAFICAFWAGKQSFGMENCTVIATNPKTRLVEQGTVEGINDGGCKVAHSVTIKDITFAGGNLEAGYGSGRCTFVFDGTIKAATEDDIEAVYASVPTGCTLVYDSVIYDNVIYKVLGYFADGFATVNWGFGIEELWLIGATATHENTIIDGIFGYTFDSLLVGEGENKATAALVAIHPKALTMSLTLHSQIGLNLMLNQKAFAGAVIELNNETYTLADLTDTNGIYKITAAIAPNKANEAINLVIVFNGYTHTIPISIATYAETILKSTTDEHKAAHNLTYAMVEYVRAMTGDEDFCNVNLEGYEPITFTKPETIRNSGYSIAFCLDEAITIAVSGTEGENITLKLPSGRVLDATVQSGAALFSDLAVNEISNTFEIVAGGNTIVYSLVDYYFAMEEPVNADVIKALYSYAQYAFAYARDHR